MFGEGTVLFEGLHYFSECSCNLKLFFVLHQSTSQNDQNFIEIIGFDVMLWNEIPRLYLGFNFTKSDKNLTSSLDNNSISIDMSDETKQIIIHAVLDGLILKEYPASEPDSGTKNESNEKTFELFLKRPDKLKELKSNVKLWESKKPFDLEAFHLESAHQQHPK